MSETSEQTGWREYLALYANLFGVGGGIVSIAIFLFWLGGFVSGAVLIAAVSVGATLFTVWLMGYVFVRSRDPLQSLGTLRASPQIIQSAPERTSLPAPRSEFPLQEIERHFELKKRQPNVVFAKSGMIGAHEDQNGRIIEGNNMIDLTFHAIVAEFNNRVEKNRAVGVVNDVSAKLTYSFFDDRPSIEITRGVWVTEGSKTNFGVNDSHRLIISSIEGIEERYNRALDGSYSGSGPRRVALSEGLIKVNVSLIAEIQSSVLRECEFMLEISPDTDILVNHTLVEMRFWKQRRLQDFVEQGIKVYEKHQSAGVPHRLSDFKNLDTMIEERTEEVEREGDAWAAKVSTFLATHLSENHRTQFIASITADPKHPRGFTDCLLAALRKLLDFSKEVLR